MIVGVVSDRDYAMANEGSAAVAHFFDRAQAAAIIFESEQSVASTLALTSVLTHVPVDQFLASSRILVIAPEDGVIRMEHVALAQRHLAYATGDAEGGHVVVFPLASSLSLPVSNALLKMIEELQLPSRCIFGVKQKTDLLPTIQSRCISLADTSAKQEVAAEDRLFWTAFLGSSYEQRFAMLEKQFSKKTKGGKTERERLDAHLTALIAAYTAVLETAVDADRLTKLQKQGAVIENIQQLCHTVSIQITLDSLLFL